MGLKSQQGEPQTLRSSPVMKRPEIPQLQEPGDRCRKQAAPGGDRRARYLPSADPCPAEPETKRRVRGIFRRISVCLALVAFTTFAAHAGTPAPVVGGPLGVQAHPGMLRVDLSWPSQGKAVRYEVQRSATADREWATLPNPTPELRRFSAFVGEAGKKFFYRVRALSSGEPGGWSPPVSATTLPFEREKLAEDVQRSAVRFFFDMAHPEAGLAPEGTPGWMTADREPICAIGASGLGMANLIVGIEHGWIPREEGLALALRMLRFLDTKADKHKGAFGHWINGATGETLNFGKWKNSVDLVETAFLIQGVILLREYFDGSSPEQVELRDIANRLIEGVEWDQFMFEGRGGAVMAWHWHPDDKGVEVIPIRGFHEAMMPYILGIGSDTHPIDPRSFYTGWMDPKQGLGKPREDFGITHTLERGIGWPLFFAHYSHIGFDPREITYDGKTYFDHFADACRIQQLYAKSRAAEFKGYDTLWGQAASLFPKGYRANEPGEKDDGTIATTAALSSMPYLPEAVNPCMESMYLNYGGQLWGAYGFYNALNPTQNWVGKKYIGIELAPIAPMIENHRSELLWRLFMKAPEVQRARERIEKAQPPPP